MCDAAPPLMNIRSGTKLILVVALSLTGCATESTTRTTMYSGGEVAYQGGGRTGTVDSVTLVTHRREGRPVAGAAAGALAGGLIFRSGAAAAGGAIAGAALSSGHSEDQAFEVIVRFDDGQVGAFNYQGQAPFRPGDRVILTRDGLAPY
jgi:outer membrane lipoprotein SlyB